MTEKLPTLVVASHNTGKITEFERILSAWWRIQPQATLGGYRHPRDRSFLYRKRNAEKPGTPAVKRARLLGQTIPAWWCPPWAVRRVYTQRAIQALVMRPIMPCYSRICVPSAASVVKRSTSPFWCLCTGPRTLRRSSLRGAGTDISLTPRAAITALATTPCLSHKVKHVTPQNSLMKRKTE